MGNALAAESQRTQVKFDLSSAKDIKSVIVLENKGVEQYDVTTGLNPWVSFGLLGAIVGGLDQAGGSGPFMPNSISLKGGQLTKALDPNVTKLQTLLAEKVVEGLSQRGYEAKGLGYKDQESLSLTVKDIKNRKTANAYLVTQLYAAYICMTSFDPYYPYLRAQVALIDAQTGKTLYQDVLTYGFAFQNQKTQHVGSGLSFSFDNMSTLTDNPAASRKGLRHGIQMISDQIVSDLGKFAPVIPDGPPDADVQVDTDSVEINP
ncbi:hypothetical protein GCM10007350_18180 [Jeongeupia chitinilytica]|uniref:Curli production assembly/transport component CsgG n=2 Tax=Jeongeupia chitinilytica TaxID=1041641 RepID=A0ABQ3H179_9NEIS|nr:hypothetical protein GCM10007350_18180 [Jeongeupia chitinilytica]